jgi:hypothetical protein
MSSPLGTAVTSRAPRHPSSWALKGGIAIIARVGDRARATSDAHATWRAGEQALRDMLDRASVLDQDDNFEFIIGRGRRIQAEGPEGGLRFPVTARIASKQFEALRLNVNLVDHDPRPIEEITPRNFSILLESRRSPSQPSDPNSSSPKNCTPIRATMALGITGAQKISTTCSS